MRAWHRLAGIAIIVLVLASACDKKSPTAPSSGVDAYLGEWTGSITSSSAGQGTLHLSIDHLDFQLLGTWTSTFPDASFNRTGTLSGLLAEDGVSLVLMPDANPDCAGGLSIGGQLVMIAQLDDGHLVADYGALDCAASKGHIDLVRR
jgi:hypothetical protein